MQARFAIVAAVLIAGASTQTLAGDFPQRRSGLWEMTVSVDGRAMGMGSTKMCVDAATDAKLMKYGMSHNTDCSPPNISGIGNTRVVDSVCHFGGRTQKSHMTFAYVGDASYHLDAHTVFDPPMAGKTDSHMTQDAKWLGACPANMKPGDMQMANGMTINILNAAGGAPGGGYGHLTPAQIQAIIKAHGGH